MADKQRCAEKILDLLLTRRLDLSFCMYKIFRYLERASILALRSGLNWKTTFETWPRFVLGKPRLVGRLSRYRRLVVEIPRLTGRVGHDLSTHVAHIFANEYEQR